MKLLYRVSLCVSQTIYNGYVSNARLIKRQLLNMAAEILVAD